MKISESTIADIIRHGDSTTMFEIIRTLIRSLNERDNRLKEQEDSSAKLGTSFVKAESERDRFRRMVQDLVSLCKEIGQEQRAESIVRAHGGLDEQEQEQDQKQEGEITVELD